MSSLVVNLHISAEQYQRLYEGTVKFVSARSVDGKTVRFPAAILRPYVTHAGISGTFQIYFSAEKRFERIEKID